MKTRAPSPSPPLLALLLFGTFGISVHAEDWFIKGRVYHNIHVIRVNPDTVSVNYDGGTGRLPLADLPPGIAQRFAADAKKAQAFAELEKKAETDAIDRLIVKLERPRDGMWGNGSWRLIKLPEGAPPKDLIAPFVDLNAKIAEVRPIEIDGLPYTAVRIESVRGEKIIILQFGHTANGGGWWSGREYPSEL